MLLTIGMASYNNYVEIYFTVQALRMYHPLDYEILIVDNYGCEYTEKFIKNWCGKNVKYVKYTDIVGTSQSRNKVFEYASGEFVLCIDSHVMFVPDSISKLLNWIKSNKGCKDLIHGVLLYDDLKSEATHMNPIWNADMWGVWGRMDVDDYDKPFEIPMHGLGVFGCFKDAWLGFNPRFRGFGGEEGYIHEKYRKHGRKVLCLPFLKWIHKFNVEGVKYPLRLEDRIRNYIIGFRELGMSIDPIIEHFGIRRVSKIVGIIDKSE